MAFDYKSLRKITSAGIVNGTIAADDIADGTINSTDIANNAVTSDKIGTSEVANADIAANAVTSAKIEDNAISLSGSKLTSDVAPVSKGGLNRNYSSGSSSQAIRTSGGGYTSDYAGLYRVRAWTSNGTWNKPSGVTRIRVQAVGGGGGGTGHGEAGGSGGYSEEYIDVTGISSVNITIGGGGGGVNYHNSAGNGGTTSFGPYLSAGGGEGARRVGGHTGGRPGLGSGGNLNIYGGGGSAHTQHGGGLGGKSYFGGSCIGVHDSSPQVSNQEGRAARGTGGTGGPRGRRRGGTGRGGIVIVWEYK